MKKITLIIFLIGLFVTAINAQRVEISTDSTNPLQLESTKNTVSYVSFFNINGYQGYTGLFTGAFDMDFGTAQGNEKGKVHLVTNASPKLTVIPNGNIGIGVTDPDARLEVNGQIKITGGSPGADKVLVSDANGLATWAESPLPPVPTYAVGDFTQGGVVFWVSANGQHGKVVSIYDAGTILWSNISTSLGSAAQSLINGAGNTVAIMLQSGHTISAARHCADLAYGGYDDWYLPSKDECNQLYTNKVKINDAAVSNGGQAFSNNLYWSSTEGLAGGAWLQNLDGGLQGEYGKASYVRVRPVRAF